MRRARGPARHTHAARAAARAQHTDIAAGRAGNQKDRWVGVGGGETVMIHFSSDQLLSSIFMSFLFFSSKNL